MDPDQLLEFLLASGGPFQIRNADEPWIAVTARKESDCWLLRDKDGKTVWMLLDGEAPTTAMVPIQWRLVPEGETDWERGDDGSSNGARFRYIMLAQRAKERIGRRLVQRHQRIADALSGLKKDFGP